MKKIKILIFIIIFAILGLKIMRYTGSERRNEIVISAFKKEYPDDDFYFIQGLDYKFDLSTHVRYRGILYSKKLEELGYPYGVELALESLDGLSLPGSSYTYAYEDLLNIIEYEKPMKDKAKKLFGKKTMFKNTYIAPMFDSNLKHWAENEGKNLPHEEKLFLWNTVVDVFVDDLEKIDKEWYKKQLYKFAEYLYKEKNIKTALQIYIRDNEFFENYNLVLYQVYEPFRGKEDIKKILNKIKNKEIISDEEKIKLINVFYKDIDYQTKHAALGIFFNYDELKDFKEQKFLRNLEIEKGWTR